MGFRFRKKPWAFAHGYYLLALSGLLKEGYFFLIQRTLRRSVLGAWPFAAESQK
jgi:hypothetical protein